MDDLISRKQAIDVAKNSCFIMRGVRSGRSVTEDAVNATKRIIVDGLHALPPAQLGTNLAEVGTRTVRGYPIDADALMEKVAEEYGERARDTLYRIIRDMPPAQHEPNYDEWCTDCKEYDYKNSCCPRWTKVIRQTRRELQDEFVMTAVDGTLWVTVDDVQKVGRVIVDEEKSKFCRQFYMDAQPEQRTGNWIKITNTLYKCDRCGAVQFKGNYCKDCGAKMEGDAE